MSACEGVFSCVLMLASVLVCVFACLQSLSIPVRNTPRNRERAGGGGGLSVFVFVCVCLGRECVYVSRHCVTPANESLRSPAVQG